MADSDKNILIAPLRTQLISQLFKYGPSWVLLFALVGFLGYELHTFVSYAGPATAEYVHASRRIDEQNAKNVATLSAAQDRTSREHESMLLAQKTLIGALDQRQEEHESISEALKLLLTQIEQAAATMSVVPGQRAEQLKLLQQIKLGIEELRATVKANGDAINPP